MVNHLKQKIIKELDNEEMASRLFDSMIKHGGPGSVGIAERPFYHSQDYIWKYFCDLAVDLESRQIQYQSALEDLERQIGMMLNSGVLNGYQSSSMSPQGFRYSFHS